MKSMVELSHDFLRPALHKQALCVDATLGNGQDTAWFLKKHARHVWGFEIQQDVLDQTTAKIADPRLEGICLSHARMDEVLGDFQKEKIDAVIFNFGWCPRQDSGIETRPDSSLQAVQKAMSCLKVRGRMALVFYPHESWEQEAQGIEDYLSGQDPHVFAIQKTVQFNARQAPFLICIEKKKSILTGV